MAERYTILHNFARIFTLLAFSAVFFLSSATTFAEQQQKAFDFPVDCELGKSCWIVNYVDTDNGPNAISDHRCGPATYDEHHGTDIALKDIVRAEKGVNVLAAMDGTVLRTRDGMDDEIADPEKREDLLDSKKGCGNGVIINHGKELQSIYCHLKKGSIKVKEKQRVKSGDVLGQIGYSGATEFPHLHFGVFNDGKTIDPFLGMTTDQECSESTTEDLWGNRPAYTLNQLFASGFKSHAPDFDALKIDTHSETEFSVNLEAFVFWAAFYNLEKHTQVEMKILDPSNSEFAYQTFTIESYKARYYYFVGKQREPLTPGLYKGLVKITSPTLEIKEHAFHVNVR
jgi:murein DD-endopeptidase MepM/ murein hydrolase activator NlpD